ncbi:putative bifunctional diguanylate cyclase/phosphodiesterase [Asanoa siamensis]|nr:EAL domain-containing protein [Asanoa siamensis]
MFRIGASPAPWAPRIGELEQQGPAPRRERPLLAAYGLILVLVAAVGLLLTLVTGAFADGVQHPAFWLLAGLAVIADARAFIATGRRGRPVIVCPSLCFSFAILLCWGLGPAIAVQAVAAAVVAWRMRLPVTRAVLMAAQFAVASTAAFGVLALGSEELLETINVGDALRDAASVVGAAAVWLVTYQLLRAGAGLLARNAAPQNVQVLRPVPTYELLFIAALLLLAPVLAVTAYMSVAFVPLVFVPLYAVERMARLAAERDLMARRDPLTSLANRTGLAAAFARLRPNGNEPAHDPGLAMLLLDLNRFKYVNDALGHEVGDRLLVAVGQRLRSAVPEDAVAARLGGDEFAVVAPVTTETDARRLAEAITEAMATPVKLEGLQVDITGSIGIALAPQDGTDFATVMRHADVAMYLAKQRGWPIQAYRAEDDHNSPERLALLSDFRHALQMGEVALHYQPQVDLAGGRVVGFEALLRWEHPTQGPIPPYDLLKIAEHTPVMRMITQRVIDEVVAQQARWLAAGVELRTSLNVSIPDLHGDEIVTQLSERLAHHKVPAELIQVEVTESALTADLAQLRATIEGLAKAGVAISLDDFGTGYSSLQHLRRLPLSEIKIDRSFVAGIAHNADDAVIVRSTVDLARALGFRVVAEGVENRYTARLLTEAGCDVAQGYLYAPAMPGDAVIRWLGHHPTPA